MLSNRRDSQIKSKQQPKLQLQEQRLIRSLIGQQSAILQLQTSKQTSHDLDRSSTSSSSKSSWSIPLQDVTLKLNFHSARANSTQLPLRGTYGMKASLFTIALALTLMCLIIQQACYVKGDVLMKVCDPREIKSVTNRVCMLYKRSKNSEVKLDREGNLRFARSSDDGDYSSDKLAQECCRVGCPPHIFAVNC